MPTTFNVQLQFQLLLESVLAFRGRHDRLAAAGLERTRAGAGRRPPGLTHRPVPEAIHSRALLLKHQKNLQKKNERIKSMQAR